MLAIKEEIEQILLETIPDVMELSRPAFNKLAGWPTFPLNELRLPHPSRFSKDGLQKLGNELFPASYPQLRGALLIH